jgi:NDP-sugar pyrophosphorylase family protein
LDNPVFLMAGGLGTRLHPLTIDCPKPMLQIGGKPILEVILKSFSDQGFHRFYICTHYMPETIRAYFGDGGKWGVSISYVHEDIPLGTGGGLGLLPRDEVDRPVIVMNCDLLTNLDYKRLLHFHADHGGVATMCVRELEHQIPYGVVTSEGQRVQSIDEKPIRKYFINAGVYVLSTELVHSIKPMRRIDMTDILQDSIHRGLAVAMFPIHEYWLDIGRMDDYKRAQAEFEKLLNG